MADSQATLGQLAESRAHGQCFSVVPGLWTVDHPFSCRKVVVVCMPRSHRWHRTVAVPLCHYYMQLQPTRTGRGRCLGAGGYPTAAHAESMPTAPPPNPGPVLRKINRGRWAAHCTAAAAAAGARTLTRMHAADSGLAEAAASDPARGSARVDLGAPETGHLPQWGV